MKLNNRNIRTFISLITFSIALLLVQSCGDDPTGVSYENAPPPFVNVYQTQADSTTDDGLQFYFTEEGSGPYKVNSNDVIQVHYTGRTYGDGEIFESTYINDFESPRTFYNLTPDNKQTSNGVAGPLIDGFRRGLLGMRTGEKRTLVIPPGLGYGNQDGHQLQADTLVYDVELLQISN